VKLAGEEGRGAFAEAFVECTVQCYRVAGVLACFLLIVLCGMLIMRVLRPPPHNKHTYLLHKDISEAQRAAGAEGAGGCARARSHGLCWQDTQ